MKKNEIIGLSVAGIAAISLLYWFKVKKQTLIAPPKQDKPQAEQNVGKFCKEPTTFPLVNGTKGATVCAIQIGLNKFLKGNNIDLEPLSIDGIIGEKTTKALNKFGVGLPISSSTTIELINKLK